MDFSKETLKGTLKRNFKGVCRAVNELKGCICFGPSSKGRRHLQLIKAPLKIVRHCPWPSVAVRGRPCSRVAGRGRRGRAFPTLVVRSRRSSPVVALGHPLPLMAPPVAAQVHLSRRHTAEVIEYNPPDT